MIKNTFILFENRPSKISGKVHVVITDKGTKNLLTSAFYCELQMCMLSKTSEKLKK